MCVYIYRHIYNLLYIYIVCMFTIYICICIYIYIYHICKYYIYICIYICIYDIYYIHFFGLSCLETTFYTFMFYSLGVSRTIFKGKMQDETYLLMKYTISQTSTPWILDSHSKCLGPTKSVWISIVSPKKIEKNTLPLKNDNLHFHLLTGYYLYTIVYNNHDNNSIENND